jgi:hypothetical protein
MNERIRELIREAESTTNEGIGFEGQEYLDMLMERFAELIVRKCIKDCRDMFVVDSVSWNLLNEKLEHFGVEE